MKKVELILIERNELKSEIETTTTENKIIGTPPVNINITNIQPIMTNTQPNITNIQPIMTDTQPNITNIQPNITNIINYNSLMNGENRCPFCNKIFSRSQRLESHLKRKSPCQRPNYTKRLPKKISIGSKDIQLGPDIIICQYCKKKFSSKDNLTKHLKEGYCKIHSPIEFNQKHDIEDEITPAKSHNGNDCIQDLMGKIQVMEKQIAELKEKPFNLEKQIEGFSAAIIESKENL
jgi:hypothetical protein